MNERMRFLAERAGMYFDGFDRPIWAAMDTVDKTNFLKDFYEAIVQDCASIDFYKLAHIGTEDDYNVTQVIKQHFGAK